MHSRLKLFALGLFLVTQASALSGCGLLIGNVRPIDEKSDRYRYLNLPQENADWVKLENTVKDPRREDTDNSDLAFQSKKTASIISINSSCRSGGEPPSHDLHDFTRELLFGISDISSRDERELKIDQVPALETTVQGKMNTQNVKLRTVVAHHRDCLYDVMYVSRPEHFASQETDFSRFVDSLKLR